MQSAELSGTVFLWTSKEEGDLAARQQLGAVISACTGLPEPSWRFVDQGHSAEVLVVDASAPAVALGGSEEAGRPVVAEMARQQSRARADAIVARDRGPVLTILTADCAPVGLASPEGIFGVVHAGWRGLDAGVVQAAVQAMRRLGARGVTAALGPCIRPECYAFSATELKALAKRHGHGLVGETADGEPALDIPAWVAASLADAGAVLDTDLGTCTGCSAGHYSHRVRSERGRQALIAYRRGSATAVP